MFLIPPLILLIKGNFQRDQVATGVASVNTANRVDWIIESIQIWIRLLTVTSFGAKRWTTTTNLHVTTLNYCIKTFCAVTFAFALPHLAEDRSSYTSSLVETPPTRPHNEPHTRVEREREKGAVNRFFRPVLHSIFSSPLNMAALSAWFWNERFWLPHNVTWADLADPAPGLEYPKAGHLLPVLPLALGIFVVRIFFERYDSVRMASWFGREN